MELSDINDIGPWSEVKLEIIREYAAAYSRILSAQARPRLKHVYINAFSGPGIHESRTSGELVSGSPTVALQTMPPFREYHFVDLKRRSIAILQGLIASGVAGNVNPEAIHCYNDDCNKVLVETIFPQVRFEDYRRALCLLDPYGLQLDWDVVYAAGQMKSVEIFLNFPIADMNRNVLRRDAESVDPSQIERMNRFWGDETWREAAYSRDQNLFGWEEKQTNEDLARAYRQRLRKVAGFAHVPEPLAMRNSKRATVYYLFFASPKPTAEHIITDIFSKHRG